MHVLECIFFFVCVLRCNAWAFQASRRKNKKGEYYSHFVPFVYQESRFAKWGTKTAPTPSG